MLAKRIIPCLDVTQGRVVKGVNFVGLRDAGDPVEIAARYNAQGADELAFLDITATSDGRDLLLPIIEAVASQVFIPLTVGGGVRSVADVRRLLNAGADKVSFNSAAIATPEVISAAADTYGAQCIVVAIDAKRRPGQENAWDVYSHGGRKNTALDAVQWAQEMARRGARRTGAGHRLRRRRHAARPGRRHHPRRGRRGAGSKHFSLRPAQHRAGQAVSGAARHRRALVKTCLCSPCI